MPLNIESIFLMEFANVQKQVAVLKATELENFILSLNDAMRKNTEVKLEDKELATKQDRLEQTLRACLEVKNKRAQEQVRKFGKPLPPILTDYFNEYFPQVTQITQLHETVAGLENLSPLAYAITQNKNEVVRALFETFTVSEFCDKEKDYIFGILANVSSGEYYGLGSTISDSMYSYVIDQFASAGDQASRPFLLMLHGLNPKIEKYESGLYIKDPKIEKNYQAILKYKEKISVIKALPFINLDDLLSEENEHIFRDKMKVFVSYLGKKQDFEQMEEAVADHTIENTIKNFIKLHGSATAITQRTGIVTAFKKFLEQVPEQFYEKMRRSRTFEDLIRSSTRSDADPGLLGIALEYGPSVPLELFKSTILSNLRNKKVDYFKALEEQYGSHRVIGLILDDIGSNAQYDAEDIENLPSLALTWTTSEKEKLFSLMGSIGTINNVPLRQWIDIFTPPKLFEQFLTQPINETITIDDKLFGHINNDHSLKGTTLEGSQIVRSLQYFNKFFKDAQDDRKWPMTGLSGDPKAKYVASMNKAQHNMFNNLQIAQIISSGANDIRVRAQSNYSWWKSKGEAYSEQMLNETSDFIVKQLIQNQGGTLPGGWIGLNNTTGHAMVYELRKTQTGYVFLIHNSGAGIEHHLKKVTDKGAYYSTLKAYEIPSSSIEAFQEGLKILVKTLVKPQLVPAAGQYEDLYSGDRLYKEIRQTAAQVGLTEADPSNYHNEWTRGQSSGTCTWRAFRSYFQSFCQEEGLSYDDLSFEVKRYAMREYFDIQKNSDNLGNGVVQRQMTFATQNLARHIRKIHDKSHTAPLWSPARRNEGRDLIQEVNSALLGKVKKTKTPKEKVDLPQYVAESRLLSAVPTPTVRVAEYKLDFRPSFVETEPCFFETTARPRVIPIDTIPNFRKGDPLAALNEAVGLCKANFQNNYFSTVTHCIEKFYARIPLDSTIWSIPPLNKETLSGCLEQLRILNSLYMASIYQQNIIPFPEQTMAIYNGLCISQHIAGHYFNDSKNIKTALIYSTNQSAMTDMNTLKKSPYFTNPDSANNERIMAVQNALYETQKGVMDFDPDLASIHLIQQVISEDKATKAEIIRRSKLDVDFQAYLANNPLPENLMVSQFYCLNRAVLKSDFPDLERDLAVAINAKKIGFDSLMFSSGKLDSAEYSISKIEIGFSERIDKELNAHRAERDPFSGQYFLRGNIGFGNTSQYTYSIRDSQPLLQDEVMRACLEAEPKDSNTIQTSTLKDKLTEPVAFQRALLRTRVDPRTQIAATVDILKSEFLRLDDPNFQQFVFLNLFQSDLLQKQVQVSPEIVQNLIDLIKRGLDIYSRGNYLKKPALHILKMSQFLETTLSSLPDTLRAPCTNMLNELSTINKIIPTEIAFYEQLHKKNPSNYTKDILRELYAFNIIRIRNQLRVNPHNESEYISALHSWLARKKLAPAEKEDPFLDYQVNKAYTEIQPQLKLLDKKLMSSDKNKVSELQVCLNSIIKNYQLSLPTQASHWEGTYPEYALILDSYSSKEPVYKVNILTAQVYQNEIQLILLPPEVCNDPLYRELCKERVVKAKVSADQSIYQFKIKDILYRYNTKNKSLYRQFEIEGIKGWYQYHENKFNEHNSVKANWDDRDPKLPLGMMDRSTTTWVSVDPHPGELQQTVIMDEAHQKVLCCYDITGSISQLSPSTRTKTGFKLMTTFSSELATNHAAFTAFEDRNFIEIWKRDEKPSPKAEINIRLERYGLLFKQQVNPDGSLGDILWVEGSNMEPRYRLKPGNSQLISGMDSILHLEPIDKKNNLTEMALIPKKQFILCADVAKESEYYKVVQDTGQSVMRAKFSHVDRNIFKSIGGGDAYETYKSFYNPRLHQYSNEEHFATYKVLPSGELVTTKEKDEDKIEDKIYLAYLYLARRQPLLAFEALKEAQKDTSNLTIESILWLKRIQFEIPTLGSEARDDKHEVGKAQIESPEFVAVRTLAASMLINEKLKQPFLITPDMNKSKTQAHENLLNNMYHKITYHELRSFWDDKNFYKSITPIVNDYYKKKNKIPDGMRLEDGEIRNVLRQLARHDPNVPAHLKFQRQELAVHQTLLEIQRLKAMKVGKKKLPPAYEARLARLERKLDRLPDIITMRKKIHKQAISLRPDSHVTANHTYDWELLNGDNSRRFATVVPITELNILTKDSNFLFSYNHYLQNILRLTPEQLKLPPSIAKLGEMKKNINSLLNAIALKQHENPNNERSFRENLTIILAYMIEFPERFSTLSSARAISPTFIQEALTIINSLNTEGKFIHQDLNVTAEIQERLILQVEGRSTAETKGEVRNTITSPTRAIPLTIDKKPLPPETKVIVELKTIFQSLPLGGTPKKEEQKEEKKKIPIKEKIDAEIKADYSAGKELNKAILDRNARAQVFWRSIVGEQKEDQKSKITELQGKLKSSIESQSKKLGDLESAIIALANQLPAPDDPKRVDWELAGFGQQRSPLTIDKILHLFLSQDKTLFQQMTALNDVQIKELNNQIFGFLLLATQKQHDERLRSEVSKLTAANITLENYQAGVNKIGFLLDLKRSFDPEKEPEILLFEYLDNKLLFQKQYDYIKGFLKHDEDGIGFEDQAVQLIMGGGKSKVLLPLLALKKATGTNLSIIEVPDALFKINRADLDATTRKIFGRQAQAFSFDDSVECDIDFLRRTRNQLRSTILNRDYLITSKESMQAFELKWLKFIKFMDPSNEEDRKKGTLFTEILKIFNYQGDVIIDEIDSTLDVRKQLIYTVGTGAAIPPHELQAVLDLHKFLHKVNLRQVDEHAELKLSSNLVGSTIQDILLGKKSPTPTDWELMFKQLAEGLVDNTSSPLQPVIEHMIAGQEKEKQQQTRIELLNYLIGKATVIPACIQNLVPDDMPESAKRTKLLQLKDMIALYKEEITSVLPLTMKKNLAEHFGLSTSPAKSDIEREIAIPFLASNTPSEKSKFGNYLETLNYTLRIQLHQPLSQAVVKTLIMHYKKQEDEEIKHYKGKKARPVGYQSPATQFKDLTGMTLEAIDFDHIQTFYDCYDAIKENQTVKEHCILNHILNHVERDSLIIASDAQNHASQFASVQGMTGTDWNYRCYPNYIKINKEISIGSDGQTRDRILRDQQPAFLMPQTQDSIDAKMENAFNLFLHHPKKNTLHAWIDVGAYFKGISNNQVAEQLASFFYLSRSFPETRSEDKIARPTDFKTSDFKHIKYVLYFGADDKLHALNVETKSTIDLETSDPDYIHTQLGCGPEGYFTYYDQRRITGTDIKQHINAHAFVSIGLNTLDRDVLQGSMRLRDLENEQRVEFVIPKELQDAHPEITHWDNNSVMNLCINNQIERLADDHFRSSMQQINNLIRNDLKKRLFSVSPFQQQIWLKKFENVFFSISNKTAFEQFGGVTKKVDTETVLKKCGIKVINEWVKMINEVGMYANNISLEEKSREVKLEDGTKEKNETAKSYAQLKRVFASPLDKKEGEQAARQLFSSIDKIISTAVDNCNKETEELQSEFSRLDSQREVSKEKQRHQEKTEERDEENQYKVRSDASPRKMKPFSKIDFSQSQIIAHSLAGVEINLLEHMAESCNFKELGKKSDAQLGLTVKKEEKKEEKKAEPSKRSWEFSANIHVTENYSQTCEEQPHLVNGYTKPATLFLVEQDGIPPTSIKFLLLTLEEAADVAEQLNSSNFYQKGTKKLWIESTHNTLEAGKRPDNLHGDYQKYIEQIAFFNGDMDILYEKSSKGSWLNEHPTEKLQYLKQVIKPIYKDKVDVLELIERKLNEAETPELAEIKEVKEPGDTPIYAPGVSRLTEVKGFFDSKDTSATENEGTANREEIAEIKRELIVKERIDLNAELINAARKGDTQKVTDLLSRPIKPDINAKKGDGTTALIAAVRRNHYATVSALLADSKIDLNATDPEGVSALGLAITQSYAPNSVDMVKILLDHGAIPDKNMKMNTMLNESLKDYFARRKADKPSSAFNAIFKLVSAAIDLDAKLIRAAETDDIQKIKADKLLGENYDLLQKIDSHRINSKDMIIENYIMNIKEQLNNYQLIPEKLAEINEELTKTLKSVSSPEVIAVKNAVKTLRETDHFFSRGRPAKAKRIEDALCNTPLQERGSVITHQGPANKVQEALASHRHFGKGGEVYKKGGEIDYEKAAQTYKSLKAEFRKTRDEDSSSNPPPKKNK